jgi:glycosyltransferase involved in cell wall biosynthesis
VNIYNYSVITACLNSSKTIKRAIDSVLSQTVSPAEYIFVDGGSADDTAAIVKSANFAKKNISLNILTQNEKNGIYGAVNQGIKAVSSDIVFILHSDDWLEPGSAEKILAKFAEVPNAEIVLTSAFFHPLKSSPYIRRQRHFALFPILMPIIHPGAFVSKKAYEKYGLYNETYSISADYDFFYRCLNSKAVFCEIRKPLVNVQLGGTANMSREKARKETLEIARKYCGSKILPQIAYFMRKILNR